MKFSDFHSLEEPMLAKIGFVVFVREGLKRNDNCQAGRPNLENEAWKGPGVQTRFNSYSKRRFKKK